MSSWAHAANSLAQIEAALSSPTITMVRTVRTFAMLVYHTLLNHLYAPRQQLHFNAFSSYDCQYPIYITYAD